MIAMSNVNILTYSLDVNGSTIVRLRLYYTITTSSATAAAAAAAE